MLTPLFGLVIPLYACWVSLLALWSFHTFHQFSASFSCLFLPFGSALRDLGIFKKILLSCVECFYFLVCFSFWWGLRLEWNKFVIDTNISLVELCFPLMWSWLYFSRGIVYHFNLFILIGLSPVTNNKRMLTDYPDSTINNKH